MMFGIFFGPFDWLLIPGMLLGFYAQMKLSSTYSRYSQEPVGSGLSGAQAAREILDQAGLQEMPVEQVPGHLTDHYDPTKRALFLSEANFHGRSLAAVGVAAHEAGHALQHQAAYTPLHIRMALVPAASFGSQAALIILVLGYLLVMFRVISPHLYRDLLPFAIGGYALAALFQLVTLPVEYDASRRAKVQLLRLGVLRREEYSAVDAVLSAAALTYVAGLVMALLELLRLVAIFRGMDDRD
jgi:Zn-dependent membrane protease YugP